MISRAFFLTILVVFVTAFFMRSPQAQTPMYCFNDFTTAEEKAAEHDESFRYSGTNLLGIEMFFFIGEKTYTIFIKSESGFFCTSPALIGVKKPKKGIAT